MDKHTLVDAVLSENGFVFGGYVRDMLTGATPRDIDCYVPPENFMSLISRLMVLGSVTLTRKPDTYGGVGTVMVALEGVDIPLEVTDQEVHVAIPCDFTVNMLILNKKGIGVSPALENRIPLQRILRDLERRECWGEFWAPRSESHRDFLVKYAKVRTQKMLDKGYKLTRPIEVDNVRTRDEYQDLDAYGFYTND